VDDPDAISGLDFLAREKRHGQDESENSQDGYYFHA
jgi:hypothetical protein